MTTLELLRETLSDPLLKSKYGITEEEIAECSFDSTSKHEIIEVIKTVIKMKDAEVSDSNIYRTIKNTNLKINE